MISQGYFEPETQPFNKVVSVALEFIAATERQFVAVLILS
jgi:hypothetical protein